MKTLDDQWRDVMSASYGPFWFTELSTSQQADCKRMFMAGAITVMGSIDKPDEIGAMFVELDKFGEQCESDSSVVTGE